MYKINHDFAGCTVTKFQVPVVVMHVEINGLRMHVLEGFGGHALPGKFWILNHLTVFLLHFRG